MVDNNSIIEGTVKFRDGKKWKSRWCVMRKLSPVADCLHLQLYRDSKDRYKQGQTKASLSLQHFLGVESGFTLDKESNTIAIICQDVTVVLAFDTRERLIQWQVKIATNLGEDQQFLIQISSAPTRAKIASGPSRLHVQEHRFCLTVGVPPRLVGFWEIRQLRRYGVVENRFCFEGGSRCGRGEGLYVLVTDQGEEITRSFQMASEGKLATRRRPVIRNMSVMDSPRKNMHSRAETRISDISCIESLMLRQQHQDQIATNETCCGCSTRHQSHEDLLVWPSSETRPDSCDYGDTASVGEFPDNHIQECGVWPNENALERCASCISKLGALSRSSTTANTPGTGFSPAWTMDSSGSFNCRHHLSNAMNPSVTRSSVSVSSHGSGSGSGTGSGSNSGSANSDYSVPRLSTTDCWSSRGTSPASVIDRCQCCPPSRPPKSAQLSLQPNTNTGSPLKKKPKPPMPLPTIPQSSCTCHHSPATPVTNPYDNYDIPKLIPHIKEEKRPVDYNRVSSYSSSDDYYDTPKNIKESLIGEYGNYDTPPSAMAVRQSCMCSSSGNHHNHQCSRGTSDGDDMRPVVCPCQRVMCWAENWMMLPYCRRGNGIENTAAPIHKVKLSGEGKMPVMNSCGEIAIYATVDKSKKTKCKNNETINEDETNNVNNGVEPKTQEELNNLDTDNTSSNYVNVDVAIEKQPKKIAETTTTTVHDSSISSDNLNYTNIDFAHSLEYYENSRDVLNRTGISQQEFEKIAREIASTPSEERPLPFSLDRNGVKICNKCGHACSSNNNGPPAPPEAQPPTTKQDDYLMMEPAANHKSQTNIMQDMLNRSLPGKNFPGYLPMHPITNTGSLGKPDLVKMRLNRESGILGERAASIPSLSGPIVDRCRKRSETEFQRVPGSAMLGVNHSVSAASSPYLRRHVMSCANDKEESRFNILARKRSSSADSTRYLDDLESITERTVSSSPTQVNNSESSKNTSVDSLSSHTLSLKRTNEVPTSTGNSLTNIPPCEDEVASRQIVNPENPNEAQKEDVVNGSLRTLVRECLDQQGAAVHIRRSSSVPCKSGNNRDSSSSNDSGVSTGSLKHRGADFAEFELPLTTSMSSRRHHHAVSQRLNAKNHIDCLHASLPRRSKSSDPLRELTFQFQKIKIPAKSSSAEAEIPVFPQKPDRKGYTSPNGDGAIVVPYIDSRSTSSGTSDMSDYIETLSLSSHSSSDTPDSLRLGRPAATTLRPRSGKEYHKIDRYILEGDLKKSPYSNITPVPEKSESPSPGYMSGSPGH